MQTALITNPEEDFRYGLTADNFVGQLMVYIDEEQGYCSGFLIRVANHKQASEIKAMDQKVSGKEDKYIKSKAHIDLAANRLFVCTSATNLVKMNGDEKTYASKAILLLGKNKLPRENSDAPSQEDMEALGYPLELDCRPNNILLPKNFDDENNNIALVGVDAKKTAEVIDFMKSIANRRKLSVESQKKISDLT
jgi:hypothetical protein